MAGMMGSALHIVFGADRKEISTPSNAMHAIFSGLISDADPGLVEEMTEYFLDVGEGGPLSNVARQGLAWVFIILQPLVFRFMMVMVGAVVGAGCRAGMAGPDGPSSSA